MGISFPEISFSENYVQASTTKSAMQCMTQLDKKSMQITVDKLHVAQYVLFTSV
jgi:hypothetical protein